MIPSELVGAILSSEWKEVKLNHLKLIQYLECHCTYGVRGTRTYSTRSLWSAKYAIMLPHQSRNVQIRCLNHGETRIRSPGSCVRLILPLHCFPLTRLA